MCSILFSGPRVGTSGGLYKRPGNVRVHQKDHGPAVPSSKRDSWYAWTASNNGVNSETPAVYPVRRQHLDHRQHVAAFIVEYLHEIHPHEQRHRGLASWAESPRVWKIPASFVPAHQSPLPWGPSDIPSNQACFREKVKAHPEEKVPRPPDQDLQPLGRVQLWCPQCKKVIESLLLPQRPRSFIKRLF